MFCWNMPKKFVFGSCSFPCRLFGRSGSNVRAKAKISRHDFLRQYEPVHAEEHSQSDAPERASGAGLG